MSQGLHLVHLYPKEMNIYGDTGNTLILRRRLEWRNVPVKVTYVGIGDKFPDDTDIIVGGGGQDTGQGIIQDDFMDKAESVHKLAEAGVVMLMVCGMYQLFGRRFVTHNQQEIKGIGLLPFETIAGPTRLIGNTVYDTPWGKMVGYENHSGLTHLDDPNQALGTVIKGAGNNGNDGTEGCLLDNVFGTYSHGPVLSKNPEFADELIRRALKRKYESYELMLLDDTLESKAKLIAEDRPR